MSNDSVANALNTQKIQYKLIEKNGGNQSGTGSAEALWPMFGRERCANQIRNTDIVGALGVKRSFLEGFAQGWAFICEQYKQNPHYNGNQADASMTHYFNNHSYATPTKTEGLVASSKR